MTIESRPEAVPHKPGLSAPLPGATTALLLLLAINMFNYLDRQILAAVEPEIREEILGHTSIAGFWSGALQFAFLITYMLIAPLFGWLADRMSRWVLVAVGVIIWSLASGASGINWIGLFAVNAALAYWLLFFTRCLVGVGEGAYGPVAPAMLSDLYPVQDRGKVMAWFYLAIPVGGALGYSLGGLVVNVFELSWHWAFFMVVPPGLLLGILCLFMKEPPRGKTETIVAEDLHQASLREYLGLFKIPSYVLNLVGMTCMTFAIGGLAWWMAAFLELREIQFVHFPGFEIEARTFFGILVAVAGLFATLLGGMAGDRLRDRIPGSYFLVSGISMMIGFPMVLLILWAPFSPFWFWVCMFLAVFSLFFNTAPTNAINANVTHPSVRASAFALNILIIHTFGDAISPGAIGLVKSFAGLETGFVLVSLLMLVGGVFWIWGSFHLQHDTEMAPLRLQMKN